MIPCPALLPSHLTLRQSIISQQVQILWQPLTMNAYMISWHDELVITLRVRAVEGIPVRDIQRQITYSQLMVTNLFLLQQKYTLLLPRRSSPRRLPPRLSRRPRRLPPRRLLPRSPLPRRLLPRNDHYPKLNSQFLE